MTTLHTVSAPSAAQGAVIMNWRAAFGRLVVMSTSGRTCSRVYGLSAAQIDLIPHGIPHVPIDAASKDRLRSTARPSF